MEKTKRIDLRASQKDERNLIAASEKLGTHKISSTIFKAVETVATMEPELYFCNRVSINQLNKNIEAGRQMLQTIADECQAIGVTINLDEMKKWFGSGKMFMVTNPEAIRETVVDKLFEMQRAKYPGLQFERGNIIIPDLTGLIEAADKLIDIPGVAYKEVGVYWHCYTIKEDIVSVLLARVEQLKDQFRAFAETAEERAKLAKVKELCRLLDSFIDKSFPAEKLNIRGVCYFDSESNRFEPSEQFIKFGFSPIAIKL